MNNYDENHWKKRYGKDWAKASCRELRFKSLAEEATGCTLLFNGLGAGTTEFISGSAAKNGYEKGAPDLKVDGCNTFIEVTGPLVNSVKPNEDLWFRPDKIDHAIKAAHEDVFLVHHCPSADLWRVIHVDVTFIDNYKRGEYPVEQHKTEKGTERFAAVSAKDEHVRPIEELYRYIKDKLSSGRCEVESLGVGVPDGGASRDDDRLLVHRDKLGKACIGWSLLDHYLTEGKGLTRKVFKDYVGYKEASASEMIFTVAPRSNGYQLRMPATSEAPSREPGIQILEKGSAEYCYLLVSSEARPGSVLNLLDDAIPW